MTRPILILLCGIPGSGKTTYAEKIKNSYTYHLSSDAIRKELYGDENIQGNPSDVFALMQDRAIMLLNNGFDVIYDATNITRKDRASIIAKCPKVAQIECHIIWAPIETCIERDSARERTVGKEVIDRMLKRFQPVFYDEGINEIKVILPDEFNKDKYCDKLIDSMKISHDNPHHTLDIYNHCMEANKYAYKMNYNDDIKFAAKFHDIGKPYVKSFLDNKGNKCESAHYYSHQNLSAWMSYGINGSNPFRVWLIGTHMEPFLETKYYKAMPIFLKDYIEKLHK
mgnify:FL=1